MKYFFVLMLEKNEIYMVSSYVQSKLKSNNFVFILA